MSAVRGFPLRIAAERARVEEWALVLVTQGLSARVWSLPEGFLLSVPPEQAERAAAVLAAYERENPPASEAGPGIEPAADWRMALAAPAAWLAFFFVTGPRDPAVHWFARGSADAERIVAGELWRCITALTLHADLGHALINALVGGFFFAAVARSLGAGLACMLVLLAGGAGNLANAFLQSSRHVSVGASSAVFGAVGVLVGLAVVRRRRRAGPGRRRAWLPVAAGLALLAMLGTGGGRVDIWAHGLGLLAGGVIGGAVAPRLRGAPARRAQALCAAAALAVVVGCWLLALRGDAV